MTPTRVSIHPDPDLDPFVKSRLPLLPVVPLAASIRLFVKALAPHPAVG